MDAYEKKVLDKYKPGKFPKCNCDEVASLWLSYSSKNPRRPYFRCQDTDPDEKCRFFQWADSMSKAKKGKRKRKTDSGKEELSKERRVKRIVKRGVESSSGEAEQN